MINEVRENIKDKSEQKIEQKKEEIKRLELKINEIKIEDQEKQN